MDCVVQLARESYAIVSYGAADISFATVSANDFNVRDNLTAHQLPVSSRHSLSMAIVPSSESGEQASL